MDRIVLAYKSLRREMNRQDGGYFVFFYQSQKSFVVLIFHSDELRYFSEIVYFAYIWFFKISKFGFIVR